jgi:hypothetical protein
MVNSLLWKRNCFGSSGQAVAGCRHASDAVKHYYNYIIIFYTMFLIFGGALPVAILFTMCYGTAGTRPRDQEQSITMDALKLLGEHPGSRLSANI